MGNEKEIIRFRGYDIDLAGNIYNGDLKIVGKADTQKLAIALIIGWELNPLSTFGIHETL